MPNLCAVFWENSKKFSHNPHCMDIGIPVGFMGQSKFTMSTQIPHCMGIVANIITTILFGPSNWVWMRTEKSQNQFCFFFVCPFAFKIDI